MSERKLAPGFDPGGHSWLDVGGVQGARDESYPTVIGYRSMWCLDCGALAIRWDEAPAQYRRPGGRHYQMDCPACVSAAMTASGELSA